MPPSTSAATTTTRRRRRMDRSSTSARPDPPVRGLCPEGKLPGEQAAAEEVEKRDRGELADLVTHARQRFGDTEGQAVRNQQRGNGVLHGLGIDAEHEVPQQSPQLLLLGAE